MASKKKLEKPDDASKPTEGAEGEAAEVVELVKMVRDGNPPEANVHPDEVENYKAGGWIAAELA